MSKWNRGVLLTPKATNRSYNPFAPFQSPLRDDAPLSPVSITDVDALRTRIALLEEQIKATTTLESVIVPDEIEKAASASTTAPDLSVLPPPTVAGVPNTQETPKKPASSTTPSEEKTPRAQHWSSYTYTATNTVRARAPVGEGDEDADEADVPTYHDNQVLTEEERRCAHSYLSRAAPSSPFAYPALPTTPTTPTTPARDAVARAARAARHMDLRAVEQEFASPSRRFDAVLLAGHSCPATDAPALLSRLLNNATALFALSATPETPAVTTDASYLSSVAGADPLGPAQHSLLWWLQRATSPSHKYRVHARRHQRLVGRLERRVAALETQLKDALHKLAHAPTSTHAPSAPTAAPFARPPAPFLAEMAAQRPGMPFPTRPSIDLSQARPLRTADAAAPRPPAKEPEPPRAGPFCISLADLRNVKLRSAKDDNARAPTAPRTPAQPAARGPVSIGALVSLEALQSIKLRRVEPRCKDTETLSPSVQRRFNDKLRDKNILGKHNPVAGAQFAPSLADITTVRLRSTNNGLRSPGGTPFKRLQQTSPAKDAGSPRAALRMRLFGTPALQQRQRAHQEAEEESKREFAGGSGKSAEVTSLDKENQKAVTNENTDTSTHSSSKKFTSPFSSPFAAKKTGNGNTHLSTKSPLRDITNVNNMTTGSHGKETKSAEATKSSTSLSCMSMSQDKSNAELLDQCKVLLDDDFSFAA